MENQTTKWIKESEEETKNYEQDQADSNLSDSIAKIKRENRIRLRCHRCKHQWVYDGKKTLKSKYPVYVTCPYCKTSVNLKTNNLEDLK